MSTEVVIISKKSAEYAEALWAKWPTPAQWPGSLDLYEAAAYRRISYGTIWRACQIDRAGKAALAHQRFGTVYRISRAALDAFGVVGERRAA
jgi:hypothetical protein